MRIIVESIDQMPGEARGGIPLGCVLETDGPMMVVAFAQGSTWSAAGLAICAPNLHTYLAIFPPVTFERVDSGEYEGGEPIEVRATDIPAALAWIQRHYNGPFDLHVKPMAVFLGEFGQEADTDGDLVHSSCGTCNEEGQE